MHQTKLSDISSDVTDKNASQTKLSDISSDVTDKNASKCPIGNVISDKSKQDFDISSYIFKQQTLENIQKKT